MFDKAYFEKEFPKHLEQFKKESKQSAEVVFVLGGNNHLIVNQILDTQTDWLSCWIYDGEHKVDGKSKVLMVTRYDQIRQVIFYPIKGEGSMGFRAK